MCALIDRRQESASGVWWKHCLFEMIRVLLSEDPTWVRASRGGGFANRGHFCRNHISRKEAETMSIFSQTNLSWPLGEEWGVGCVNVAVGIQHGDTLLRKV